jgi:nitroimidazol reductase NimA-like FMN-containing flavoprotein (pyridoxamine 5'-phosphate oxidase superfamily)
MILYDILESQKFAVIATQYCNEPYTNLVAFVCTNHMKNIIFNTSKKSKKYRNLKNNSNVSLLIDNRGNDPSDIQNAVAVTAIGIAKEITDYNKGIKRIYLKKHGYLFDFVNSKDSVFFDIAIDNYIVVNHFQNINIINP